MSRAIILVILALVLFSLGMLASPAMNNLLQKVRRHTAGEAAAEAPFDSLGYEQKSSEFAALHETRPIVFLGDSRVEHGQWSELFARCDISNRGISGDTTAGVLRRLLTSMPTDGVLCIVQVGINDLSRGARVETVLENYRAILDYLQQQRHANVVVTSIILAAREHSALNKTITDCNAQLAQLTAARQTRWIDLNPMLAPQGSLSPNFTVDGVHLNGAGYTAVRDALAPIVNATP